MIDVVDTANSTINLEELFDLTSLEVVKIILKLLVAGWLIFNAVVLLLSLAFPAFLAALASFSLTPLGVAVLAIFGVSMVAIMRLLYKNRQLPIAIKKVGDSNKEKYYSIRAEYANDIPVLVREIDGLLFKAVDDLIARAKNQAEALKARALTATFEKIYMGYTSPDANDLTECVTDVGRAALDVEKENLKDAAGEKIR